MKLDSQTSCDIKIISDHDALVRFESSYSPSSLGGTFKCSCYIPLVGTSALRLVDIDTLRWIREHAYDPKRVIMKVESEVRLLVEDRVMEAILG